MSKYISTRWTAGLCMAFVGCSWLLVTPPPSEPASPELPIECTAHRVWPVADTAIALLGVVGAIYFLQADGGNALGAAVDGALALGFGWSAVDGWQETSACRRALQN